MQKTLVYSLKVWLTTCIVTPVIWFIGFQLMHINKPDPSMLAGLFFLILATIVFSLLTWLLFWMGITAIAKYTDNRFRLIIFLLGELLTIASFLLFLQFFKGVDQMNFRLLMLIHCVVIGAAIWWYKL